MIKIRGNQLKPGETMIGTLVAINDNGYGFISLGPGKPQIFVRVVDVHAGLWRLRQQLRFTVHPPEKGRCWVARDVEVGNLPSASDLDCVAEELRQARPF